MVVHMLRWACLNKPYANRGSEIAQQPTPTSPQALRRDRDRLRAHDRCPQLMGIINVTPDSFSDGGVVTNPAAAIQQAQRHVRSGALWIDVGGESSRPGAEPVDMAEEQQRVLPVLEALVHADVLTSSPASSPAVSAAISVDTRRAAVARAALAFAPAVALINDITAGQDPDMFAVVADSAAALCLMHMQGRPQTMQQQPSYENVVASVIDFFEQRVHAAERAGIDRQRLVLDPGIGFGKTLSHNFELLSALPRLRRHFQLPVLVGVSRKSLLSMALGRDIPAPDRDPWSQVLHAQIAPHCDILRVHDVAGAHDACRLVLPEWQT